MTDINPVRPVFIDVFGPPQLGCIRSWGRQGFDVGMVHICKDHEKTPNSKYLKDVVNLHADKCYTNEGFNIIKDFLNKFRASGVACLNPKIALWLNENRNKFPKFVDFWIPSTNSINSLISKKNQIKAARDIGFDVLPTFYITKEKISLESINPDHYPICVRPTVPEAVKPTFKVKILKNQETLKSLLNSTEELSAPLVAQPFKHLPNIICYGSRSSEGKTSPTIAFMVEHKFEGVGWIFFPAKPPNNLIEKCIKFAEYFKVTGCWEMEFLYDNCNKTAYFLEMNNRFGGHTAKVLRCGYDEPSYCLNSYGITTTNDCQLQNIRVTNRQAILKFMFLNLRGKLSPLDYPDVSGIKRMFNALKAFLFYADEIWSWDDLNGSFSLYFGNFQYKLLSLFNKSH